LDFNVRALKKKEDRLEGIAVDFSDVCSLR